MELTTASIFEKNKTASEGVYLLLLEIRYKDITIHLVANNESYTFQGTEYLPFDFKISEISKSSSETPMVTLSVSNKTGAIQKIVEENNGIGGAEVHLIATNTNVPDEISDEEVFRVTGNYMDGDYVAFKLGTGYSLTRRFPFERLMKDYCQAKYKGVKCKYAGSDGSCNKTLSACRARNNSKNFGGCPTIPQGGLYVRNR